MPPGWCPSHDTLHVLPTRLRERSPSSRTAHISPCKATVPPLRAEPRAHPSQTHSPSTNAMDARGGSRRRGGQQGAFCLGLPDPPRERSCSCDLTNFSSALSLPRPDVLVVCPRPSPSCSHPALSPIPHLQDARKQDRPSKATRGGLYSLASSLPRTPPASTSGSGGPATFLLLFAIQSAVKKWALQIHTTARPHLRCQASRPKAA